MGLIKFQRAVRFKIPLFSEGRGKFFQIAFKKGRLKICNDNFPRENAWIPVSKKLEGKFLVIEEIKGGIGFAGGWLIQEEEKLVERGNTWKYNARNKAWRYSFEPTSSNARSF